MATLTKLSSNRRQCDFTKLITSGYDLELVEGNSHEFMVVFQGPIGTPYEKGMWRVHVTLPDEYPFASPSIGFVNKILHPNVDERSGSVCLDVINQTWTPMYSLVNVFDIFLPQLLTYPNASDPLNSDAAALMMRDRTKYDEKIRDYVSRYATPEGFRTPSNNLEIEFSKIRSDPMSSSNSTESPEEMINNTTIKLDQSDEESLSDFSFENDDLSDI